MSLESDFSPQGAQGPVGVHVVGLDGHVGAVAHRALDHRMHL